MIQSIISTQAYRTAGMPRGIKAMAPLHISVVLCGYTSERWDDLRAAVESVRQQTLPPDEIILVIDHNPALYARACAELPDVIVMETRSQRAYPGRAIPAWQPHAERSSPSSTTMPSRRMTGWRRLQPGTTTQA